MQKPRERSKVVDDAIKTAYAKLAQRHFTRAEESIGTTSDIERLHAGGCIESTRRMHIVEDYLERAGAQATKWSFRG